MLTKWEMDVYREYIIKLSDADLEKEKQSCENSQLDDPWYLAACYAELAKRKTRREMEWQMR